MRQAFTDTDSDGLDDDWETTHFGSLSETATGDFDSDGMTNLEEYDNGFDPTVNDAFEDADGDRYPNIFELRGSSDPNSASSTPTANYTVDVNGGGTHTSLTAAYNASDVSNGAYQIIAVAPGTYSGSANDLTLSTSKPKLLIIGLEGAAKTIVDGGANGTYGWNVNNAAVIASLTFQQWSQAIWVSAGTNEVRLVDLVVRNNGNPTYPGGLHLDGKTYLVGSTLLDNFGGASYGHLYVTGQTTMLNTVVWGSSSPVLVKTGGATLVTNNCLIKGETLTGTGNLAGTTDPKLRADGRLLWDSPLRAAGGAVTQSKIDMDGETRPSTPDIGADQFVDSDSDDLADAWETAYAGNLTSLTSRTQDADSDGLSNEAEYAYQVNPTVADTDGDSVSDGDEVNTYSSNPLATDSDGDDMPDGWEVTYGLSPTVASRFEDADGDGYPNVFEYARGSDPSSASSTPTANYTVDVNGGGTHTSLTAAYNASDVSNGAYQIIAVAPGTYSGSANDLTLSTSKPKFLIIGLQGAAKTIIDGTGSGDGYGWNVNNAAVIASLTFQKWSQAMWVSAGTNEVRLVDLLVKNNGNATYPGGVHLDGTTYVIGSTFLDNFGGASYGHVYVNGNATLLNTVVWGSSSPALVKSFAGTLTTNNCLVKGQTLTGTGNLAGTTDPKLRADGRLLRDSPLRSAGGAVAQSKLDMDGETRPSTPDIGVDQFVDTDSDDLADAWELTYAGNLTSLTSLTQDADSDGLSNEAEYANNADPTVADTDGDGLSDGDEVNTYSTNPLLSDSDGDDMPDGWEVTYGLSPTVANRFQDVDGDGYPDVFEYARGSDPSSASSTPTANYTVDVNGGGTHTSLTAAYNASDISNGAYQIIAVAPGTYSGSANDLTLSTSKPKFLIIGLEGAAKTIIDGTGSGDGYGWNVNNAAVIASLTFQKWSQAMWVSAGSNEVRLVDLLVKNNGNATYPGGVHLDGTTYVIGSTFLDNFGGASYGHVYVNGNATLLNTVVWGSSSPALVKSFAGTLTTNNCLVKGETLTGTGNLAGTTDPKLRPDGRLRSDSPLRGAGGAVAQSRLDMDGELRPTSAPDIGVDQFVDADSDLLPDSWELATAGNLTTIAGAADDDADGLTNAEEVDIGANYLDADSDNDGLDDSHELALGLDPLAADTDDLVTDANGDGLMDNIGAQLAHQPDRTDDDGDGVSNADEILMCTNPFRADTDGDGVPDNSDVFPHDPLMSALPTNGSDTTAPVITLTAPWNAVLQ